MAHVGIERLGAGYRKHRRAHGKKAAKGIGREHCDGVVRAERADDRRKRGNADHAQHGDRGEIKQHQRAEQIGHFLGATTLEQEKRNQDRHHDRHDQRVHFGAIDGHALDRAHHRHCRRDHRVAIKQRRGKHAQQDDAASPAIAGGVLVDQGKQRKAAALAFVVGAHDHRDILQCHDDHHRPEHQADDAIDMQLIEGQLVVPGERVAQGIKRAGADIAENHAQRTSGHLDQAAAMPVPVTAPRVFVRRVGACACSRVSHGNPSSSKAPRPCVTALRKPTSACARGAAL